MRALPSRTPGTVQLIKFEWSRFFFPMYTVDTWINLIRPSILVLIKDETVQKRMIYNVPLAVVIFQKWKRQSGVRMMD